MTVAPEAEAMRPALHRPTPFVGVGAFEEEDAPLFFGRGEEAEAVVASVRSTRLTVLHGPSGAGRTSLLLAGVVPRLREEGFRVLVARDDVEGAVRAARDATMVLVVDGADGFAELAPIVSDETLPVHVVLSLRDEELDRLDVPAALVRLGPLAPEAAREAIEGPVFAWNRSLPPGDESPYYVEGNLVDLLAAELEAEDGGVEPMLLQLVLDALWRATVADRARVLTVAGLEALGLKRIVERHVAGALGRLSRRERLVAAACFRHLATRARTMSAHSAADLAEWTERPESQVTALLDKLGTAEGGRLVRAVIVNGTLSYELFHPVYLEPVQAWRRRHDARRQADLRRQVSRIGTIALALVALFAAVTVWALAGRDSARSHYGAQQRANRALEAQVLRLTAAQRAARKAAAAQAVVVRKLTRQNAAVDAQTAGLEKTRAGLDAQIGKLVAANQAVVTAIDRFNTWNAALTKNVDGLDTAYDGLAAQLTDLRAQRTTLQNASGTLAAEASSQRTELATLTALNEHLAGKAALLGFSLPAQAAPSPTPAPKPGKHKPTTAPTFTAAAAVAVSDPIRRQVAALDEQLAALAAAHAPAAGQVRWLRQEAELLVRRRDTLAQENAELAATQTALESRNRALEQTRSRAAAEHTALTRLVAARTARNGKRANEIATLQKGNASLQDKAARQIAALGATLRSIEKLQAANASLVAFLEPNVSTLTRAALAPSVDPQLGGLLAALAYRLTPFDPDDAAQPAVYNTLVLSLQRLDKKAATALLAPVATPTGKVGSPRAALIVKALCGRLKRGLSPAEWSRYLPAGANYTARAANPCA